MLGGGGGGVESSYCDACPKCTSTRKCKTSTTRTIYLAGREPASTKQLHTLQLSVSTIVGNKITKAANTETTVTVENN